MTLVAPLSLFVRRHRRHRSRPNTDKNKRRRTNPPTHPPTQRVATQVASIWPRRPFQLPKGSMKSHYRRVIKALPTMIESKIDHVPCSSHWSVSERNSIDFFSTLLCETQFRLIPSARRELKKQFTFFRKKIWTFKAREVKMKRKESNRDEKSEGKGNKKSEHQRRDGRW